ncbi:MAG: hypothetical protein AABY16_03375 [Nanoarchaeota archaeon]
MNRRGTDNTLTESIIYLLIFILFFLLMFYFVSANNNGAFYWEDFYAKELALVIDRAEPGMEFAIDVSELSRVAIKKGKNLRDLILIDNINNKVTVSVRPGAGTSFLFFNDVDIVIEQGDGIVLPSGGATTTQFKFKVKERQRDAQV